MLLVFPTFAQRREVGTAPPQPVQFSVKVRREGKTEIPLSIHGKANEPLKFLIRTPPAHGKLTEPRATGRETASVVYEPPADVAITADRFFYAAQGVQGVSAPVEVALTITDQPPRLAIPDRIDFGNQKAGATATRMLEISNQGGGLDVGEVIVDPPWRIEGRATYRLKAGDLTVFKLIFTPTTGGNFEGFARFTSDPAHSTTLLGAAESPITAPAQITLAHEANDTVRTGSVELANQTDEARTLALKTDARLQVPAQVTLPARGKITIPLQTAPADIHPLDAELRIASADLTLRIPVRAAAVGAVFRMTPSSVDFGKVASGQTKAASFEIENIGGQPGEITWTVGAPFRVAQTSTLLTAGEKRAFPIELSGQTSGRFRAWVRLQSGERTWELPLAAEVAGGAVAARGLPAAAPIASADPITTETAAPTTETPPTVPRESSLPPGIFSDRTLPAGVKASATTPTTATIEWPASLSPATNFRVDLRQFGLGADRKLQITWLELSGLKIERVGDKFSVTIRELQPAQPWTIRVRPVLAEGPSDKRLFAIDFATPPKASLVPKITPWRGLLLLLGILVFWQIVSWWRRRKTVS